MRWIGVDSSRQKLRVWRASGGGAEVLDVIKPAGSLHQSMFPTLLGAHLEEDAKTPVIWSGKTDGPFIRVPAVPLGRAHPLVVPDPRMALFAVPSLSQIDPPDVTLGAQTAIAGFLARCPQWDGVICLPGMHSRWAHISAGEVVSFRSFLTGELFTVLSNHAGVTDDLTGAQVAAAVFEQAVSDAVSRPERVASALFSLRAEMMLDHGNPATARVRLAGMLIGMELAAARPYWLGQNVILVAQDEAAQHYGAALLAQGVTAPIFDYNDMTLDGLQCAYNALQPE
jgi:2-dehydro-3-deoxygalactonokinase